ncbi:hypothetical protein H2O64_16835 [Kordia sp. YSTF-M3]|uniref:Adhesin domain-containing protein n=1 Tax=Kordia aestuariivivens TaxID=2759037 RepID=A0ABR7QCX2_9FLAO|nr:hypothetical protein [Kordia aestuariivivens]MBC8756343.1 hypothetical protein [Kordia aestuariivivens]
MNKKIYSLVIMLFIGSFGLMAQTQKKYQKTFSVDKNTRLNFETTNIDVTFKVWDKDEVKVDFEINFKNYTAEEEKHVSNGIVVYAAMQTTMGDSNYLEIKNASPTSVGNFSYQLSDGHISIENIFAEKNEPNQYKTVSDINKMISENGTGFQDLEGFMVFKNDSVALKDIKTSNHKGIQSIRATYEIYIPSYMIMNLHVNRANVYFEGKFTNTIVGSFQESNLIAKELNNKDNSIAFRNGSIKIKKVIGGGYMFKNVTHGVFGQLENVMMQTEFSKIIIGEITKNVQFSDFKSDFLIHNLGKNFESINMMCEYSDIKLYTIKNQNYYMEAVGNNAVMNDKGMKIVMQPNRNGEKTKMFSRGKDTPEVKKNMFKLDLVHGFVTLLYNE